MKKGIPVLHPPFKWTRRRAAAHICGSQGGSAAHCTIGSPPPQPGAGPETWTEEEEGPANQQWELKKGGQSSLHQPYANWSTGCKPGSKGSLWAEQETSRQRLGGGGGQSLKVKSLTCLLQYMHIYWFIYYTCGLPCSVGGESACNAGDLVRYLRWKDLLEKG